MTQSNDRIFSSINVGSKALGHRIAMAPLTRCRATSTHVPTPVMAEYYRQRSCAPGTLIISETVYPSPRASGTPRVPGVWSAEQIAAWKPITQAVHENHSFFFMQLVHVGRLASEEVLRNVDPSSQVVGPSPIRGVPRPGSPSVLSIPHELTIPEIKEIVEDFVTGARNAIEAGADGVEIQGANGFLISQFLSPNSNHRTDEYGGSIENRARFVLEVVDAVSKEIGAERVGIRFSPFLPHGGATFDISPIPQFSYLVSQLEKRARDDASKRLAYIHLFDIPLPINSAESLRGLSPKEAAVIIATLDKKDMARNVGFIRQIWTGILIKCGVFELDEAKEETEKDDKLIIAFGKFFISNPDLVERFKTGKELTKVVQSTVYLKETAPSEGYTDYPFAN